MEIMGIKIPTIITENSGIRCEGCREQITGCLLNTSYAADRTNVWAVMGGGGGE